MGCYTDYIIPNDINPVINNDVDEDEWNNDDIMTIIGSDELDASIEAAESFDEFLKVEEEELLSQHADTKYSTEMTTATSSGANSSEQYCSSQLCEGDSFLDNINWDEALDNT